MSPLSSVYVVSDQCDRASIKPRKPSKLNVPISRLRVSLLGPSRYSEIPMGMLVSLGDRLSAIQFPAFRPPRRPNPQNSYRSSLNDRLVLSPFIFVPRSFPFGPVWHCSCTTLVPVPVPMDRARGPLFRSLETVLETTPRGTLHDRLDFDFPHDRLGQAFPRGNRYRCSNAFWGSQPPV